MHRDRSMDIAVTGISARFPGVTDLDEWWSALITGQVLTKRYDRNALIESGISESLLDDPNFVPVHGLVYDYHFLSEVHYDLEAHFHLKEY